MSLILLVLVVEECGVVVLLHELLRWLIDVHVGHLLLRLTGLLVSCGFLLLLSLSLVDLDFLELIEDVLVMQEGVGEFVHEGSACQESIDATLNHWHLEKLVNGGSLGGVSFEHHRDDVVDGWGEVGGKGRVVTLNNFLGQLV